MTRWLPILALCLVGALAHANDRVVGWRGDGSGSFADARPPVTFSEKENMRWKAEIGQGCGAVIVVGNRLFVQAAPNALVCLDKETGKELWRRTHHAEGLDPKSPAAQLDASMDDVGAYHVAVQCARAAPKDAPNRTELDTAVVQAEAKLPKGTIAQVPGAGIGGYGYGGIYLMCMTPCSDGRTVVAVFPTGIAVAYDMKGTRLWSVSVRPPAVAPKDYPKGRWRPVPSSLSTCPVLTEEGIVVAIYGACVYGVDARDGTVRWRDYVSGSHASPVVGKIGGHTYVASGDGYIFRAGDGRKVYADPRPAGYDSPPAPLFADGVFYWVSHAVKVTDGETPTAEVVWDIAGEVLASVTGFGVKSMARTGPGDMTSPIVLNGCLLHYNQHQQIVALELATGKELGDRRPTAPTKRVKPLSGGVTKHWAYGGMVRAGDQIIVAHDNGLVKVIPVDRKAGPGVVNALPDDIYAQPTCDGPALYVRTLHALYRFDNPDAVQEGRAVPR